MVVVVVDVVDVDVDVVFRAAIKITIPPHKRTADVTSISAHLTSDDPLGLLSAAAEIERTGISD
jgi:hypothetical protein